MKYCKETSVVLGKGKEEEERVDVEGVVR